MFRIEETRDSWSVQRLANRYPPDSRISRLRQSVGQLILNAFSKFFDDSYWWANYNLYSSILNTCDKHQLSSLRRLNLPGTFEFRTQGAVSGTRYLAPTSVRGQLSDGTWKTLAQATDNVIEEFWYGLPTRITDTGETDTYIPVLPLTNVSQLGSTSPIAPGIAGKLWVSLSNNTSAIRFYRQTINWSRVEIHGYDIHGHKRSEYLRFAYNGTQQTKVSWSEVTSIETKFIDDTASIRIDWLNLATTDLLDKNSLFIEGRNREKFKFYSLSSKSYGSVLQHKVFSAPSIFEVQEGDESKYATREIEILDSSGNAISANSIAIWPYRKWIVASTGSKLHFYHPQPTVPDYSELSERTLEVVVQFNISKEFYVRDDQIPIRYRMTRPNFRLLRTRLSVKKPDGTRVGITPDGAESVYSDSGWVEHEGGSRYDKVGYISGRINYTLSSSGTYVFYLESYFLDNLNSSESFGNGVTQTDVFIAEVCKENALQTISLPTSVGEISGIAFDAYERPWVIDSFGNLNRLQFHYDTYLVDFTNKSIIVREPYTKIEVDA